MGLLRVLLALAVLFEHTGGLGSFVMLRAPIAVQCFFLISGFYMGLVLNERYDRPALNGAFYVNRALRIYGIYFLFLAAHFFIFALVQATTGDSPLAPYFDDSMSVPAKVALGLLNLTVVGQELPVWLHADQGSLAWSLRPGGADEAAIIHFMLIPAAWSLSLEICFYALAPFIARRPAWQIGALLGASLLLRVIGARFGLVNDPYSFRFFPFELAVFLAGVLAYKAWAANRQAWDGPLARALALCVPVAILAYPWFSAGWPDDLFFTPPRIFLLATVALGLPAIHGWTRSSVRDRAVGEFSYPLYLDHLLVVGLIGGLPVLEANPALGTIAVIAVSLALAWLAVRFVDRRIDANRRERTRRALATVQASGKPPLPNGNS